MLFQHKENTIKGVDVFLEKFQTRAHVGVLEKRQEQFCFEYTPTYFKAKNSFPLGPEFPLTRQTFLSNTLFPSFLDRLPDPENPAYPDYCAAAGISITTTDPFILLTTIGKRGPSSFIFEPIYKETFTYDDYENFRKSLGLSMQDFANLFDVSLSVLQKIKAGETSGKEVLKRLELYQKIPEALQFQIRQKAKWIHTKKYKDVMQKNMWKPLWLKQIAYTQKCREALEKNLWAKELIKKVDKKECQEEDMPFLFEVRFAYALSKTSLKIECEHKTGIGKTDVGFLVTKVCGEKWLLELTSMWESDRTRENTFISDDWQCYSSTTTSADVHNSPETLEIIKAQNVILSKVAKDNGTGKINPTKFPEPSENTYHIIVVDMGGFAIGKSDDGDYINILYGTREFENPEDRNIYGRYWIDPETGNKSPILGIFDSQHPDEKTRYLQERVHGVAFIREQSYQDGEIERVIRVFHNPNFFKENSELQTIFPMDK